MNITCPIDQETLEVPREWDHDIEFQGVLIHEWEVVTAAWLLLHVRKEHGLDTLVSLLDSYKAGG